MESTSLDSIAGGGSSQSTEAQAPAVAETGAAPAEPQQGVESASPAQAADPTAQTQDIADNPNAPEWARKAVTEERKKRQQMAEQLAELNGRLSAYERQFQKPQAQPEPQAEKPDYWADPEKFTESKVTEVEQRIKGEVTKRVLFMGEAAARAAHSDYDVARAAFVEAAQQNPALAAEFRRRVDSPEEDFAGFVYSAGKTYLEAKKYGGDMEKMREAIRQEERAKAEAEVRKQLGLSAATQASRSTAGARGASAPTTPAHSPTPLSGIARNAGI